MNDPRACSGCAFWQRWATFEGGHQGPCRRYAPRAGHDGDGYLKAAWPLVFGSDFCGEFEPRDPPRAGGVGVLQPARRVAA